MMRKSQRDASMCASTAAAIVVSTAVRATKSNLMPKISFPAIPTIAVMMVAARARPNSIHRRLAAILIFRIGFRQVETVNLIAHAPRNILFPRQLVQGCRAGAGVRYCRSEKIIDVFFDPLTFAIQRRVTLQRIVIRCGGSRVFVWLPLERLRGRALSHTVGELCPGKKPRRDEAYDREKDGAGNGNVQTRLRVVQLAGNRRE